MNAATELEETAVSNEASPPQPQAAAYNTGAKLLEREAAPDTELPERDPAADTDSRAGGDSELEPPPVRLSRRSRIVLAVSALLIVLVTGTQMAAMFLASAPPSTLSVRYNAQLNWWIKPWLGQNWKLFGPNPQTENPTILARARNAAGAQSAWVDLTAIDYSAVLHDPMPSHANENELRLALSAYENSAAGGQVQGLLQQYLTNFVAERLGLPGPASYTQVQIEVVNTPMPLPGSSAPRPPTNHYLPWWTLTGKTVPGL